MIETRNDDIEEKFKRHNYNFQFIQLSFFLIEKNLNDKAREKLHHLLIEIYLPTRGNFTFAN